MQVKMRVLIALCLVALTTAELAPLLKNDDPIPGKYIIRIKTGYKVGDIVSTVRRSGGRVGHVYRKVLHGFAAQLSDNVLDIVRNLAAVEYVEQDGVVRAHNVEWGLDRIDQRYLPLDGTYDPLGDGGYYFNVYVLDTGINDAHNDFGGRALHVTDVNFIDNEDRDCNGHGTHCAGTVGSETYGVAKDVLLTGVKVLSCEGYGSTSGIIAATQWVMDDAYGNEYYNIVSMSIGGGYSTSFNDAIDALVTAGIKTVVSAGNDNSNACWQSPASAPLAITVGATDDTDTRSSFSNYGSCVDIFAPGTWIQSTWFTSPTSTYYMSGTSMACPHVAGGITLFGGSDYNMMNRASKNKISDVGTDSPNRLLYVGHDSAEPGL